MWFAKSGNGFRGWFAVTNARGSLVSGLTSTDFLVTVRNPQDNNQTIPTVVESGKPGLYRFDISNTFLQLHGTGTYAVIIEISTSTIKDVVTNILQVNNNDIDSIATGSVQITSQNIQDISTGIWNYELSGTYVQFAAANLLNSASVSSSAQNIWDYTISGSSAANLLISSSVASNISATIDYSQISQSVWQYYISGSTAANIVFSSSLPSSCSIDLDYDLIATNVWGYNISGTLANSLLTSSSMVSSATIDYLQVSNAVWNAQTSSYNSPATFGNSINTNVLNIANLLSKVDDIRDIQFGRWKIENNQMIFYKEDNITEIARFDLYDNIGAPTVDAVFERIKV